MWTFVAAEFVVLFRDGWMEHKVPSKRCFWNNSSPFKNKQTNKQSIKHLSTFEYVALPPVWRQVMAEAASMPGCSRLQCVLVAWVIAPCCDPVGWLTDWASGCSYSSHSELSGNLEKRPSGAHMNVLFTLLTPEKVRFVLYHTHLNNYSKQCARLDLVDCLFDLVFFYLICDTLTVVEREYLGRMQFLSNVTIVNHPHYKTWIK